MVVLAVNVAGDRPADGDEPRSRRDRHEKTAGHDHPQKVDKFSSGDGIRILPTAELLKRMPAYTVILAWVHSAKIIETNREYLERGGRFVVLCPETRVVGRDGDVKV